MKELKYFARWSLCYAAVYGGFAAIVIAGVLLSGSLDNLFGSYARMFGIFVIIFPFIFAASGRATFNIALGFGARRMPAFWAMETMHTATALVLLAATKLINIVCLSLPGAAEDYRTPSRINGSMLLLLLIAALMLIQAGLAVSCIERGKSRAIVIGMLMLGLLAAVGLVALVVFLNDTGAWKTLFPVSLTNPVWLAGAAAMLVIGGICGGLAHHFYKKAVVIV